MKFQVVGQRKKYIIFDQRISSVVFVLHDNQDSMSGRVAGCTTVPISSALTALGSHSYTQGKPQLIRCAKARRLKDKPYFDEEVPFTCMLKC